MIYGLGHMNLTHENVHKEEPISNSYEGMSFVYKLMGLRHYFRKIDAAKR